MEKPTTLLHLIYHGHAMQLRNVKYYSDVLISIDIYAQSHSKRALEGGGGRSRTKCILINHSINKGGPSQVGGSYSCLGGGASALKLHLVPHPPLWYVNSTHVMACLDVLSYMYIQPSPMLVTEGHEGNDHIHHALSTSGMCQQQTLV